MAVSWASKFRNKTVQSSSHDNVCTLCRNLSPTSDDESTTRVDIVVPSLYRQKGATNCPYCALIKEVFNHFSYASFVPTITLECAAGKPIVMQFEGCDDHFQLWYLLYKAHGTVVPSWPSLGGSYLSSDHLGSDESLQFIRECLNECASCSKTTHQACYQSKKRLLPKRVLDVRSDVLKLVNGEGQFGEYCSLSYRWGSSGHTFQMTKANMDKLMKGFDLLGMPRLLQDAIEITRRLGITYLWIDALCIIQGDQKDWETEAPKMGLYYKQAVITIAAASAQDVRQPFLIPRERIDENTRPKFNFRNKDDTTSTIIVCQVPDYAGISIVANSSLSTRGWTWQENVLSTRIVHFTKTEIIWECRSQQRFQNGATLRTSVGLAYRFASAKDNIEHYWKALVADYSKRDLTYESDRLPAISGVASELRTLILNGQYMAGIWKQWIFSELLWVTNWGEENRHPPRVKGLEEMPSWSWASIIGQVFYKFQACEQSQKHTALKIIDIDCPPRGANPFGQVKEKACIVLEAPLFPARLVTRNGSIFSSYNIFVNTKKPNPAYFWPDTILLEESTVYPYPDPRLQNTLQARRMCKDEAVSSIAKPLNVSISCLYLGGGRYSTIPSRRLPSLKIFAATHYYLILTPIIGEQPSPIPMFSRLGLLKLSDSPPWKAQKTRVMLL